MADQLYRSGQNGGSESNSILNNVNLFTGQITAPVCLAELHGPTNLSFSLQITYQSSTSRQFNTPNRNAPQSVLGYGWILPLAAVTVTNRQVRETYQADFSFSSEGGQFPLYRTGGTNGVYSFYSPEHPLWEFTLHQENGKHSQWVIRKENGQIWRYGGSEDSIEQLLAWDNWVGPTVARDGTPFPVGWYLRSVENHDGGVITLTYDNVCEQAGGGLYTRAMRYKTVTSAFGETLRFNYAPKSSCEFQPAHESIKGINAYQCSYEDCYLASLEVLSPEGVLLYKQALEYKLHSFGSKALTKRYLTSVCQVMPEDRALPPMKFCYDFDSSCPAPGTLSSISRPNGAQIRFEHSTLSFKQADGTAIVEKHGPEWKSKVLHAQDYSVILDSNGTRYRFRILYWDTGWATYEDQSLMDENLSDVKVNPGQGFVALTYYSLRRSQYILRLFNRSTSRNGEWICLEMALDKGDIPPATTCGSDFFAFQRKAENALIVMQLNNNENTWAEKRIPTQSMDFQALGAGRGFILGAFYNSAAKTIRLQTFYADADHTWKNGHKFDVNQEVDWRFTSSGSVWSVGACQASATFLQLKGETKIEALTLLMRWREGFQLANVKTDLISQNCDVDNPILFSQSSDSLISFGQNFYRYRPGSWETHQILQPQSGGQYRYACGADLGLATEKISGRQRFYAIRYDPYHQTWTRDKVPVCGDLSEDDIFQPAVIGDYALLGRNLFYRNTDSTWTLIHTLPNTVVPSSIRLSINYLLYQIRGREVTVKMHLDYGKASEELSLPGEICDFPPEYGHSIGINSFNTFMRDNRIKLYALADGRYRPYPSVPVVNKIQLKTIRTVQQYLMEYDLGSARIQAYTPGFGRVRCIPVDAEKPYGYIEYLYFNGIPDHHAEAFYPEDDAYSNAKAHYSRFYGQMFSTDMVDAEGHLVEHSVNYLKALDSRGFVIRNTKTVRQNWHPVYDLDKYEATENRNFTESVLVNTYEPRWHQLRSIIKSGNDGQGRLLVLKTQYTYGFEIYPELAKRHILDLPVHVIRQEEKSGVNLEAWASRWGESPDGRWHALEELKWNGIGDPVYPVGNADNWYTIKRVHSWTSLGFEAEVTTEDGRFTSNLYDTLDRQITAFADGNRTGEVLFSSFEPYERIIWTAGGNRLYGQMLHTDESFCGTTSLMLQPGDVVMTVIMANLSGPYTFNCAVKTACSSVKAHITGSCLGRQETITIELAPGTEQWTQVSRLIRFRELAELQNVKLEIQLNGPASGSVLIDVVTLAPLDCELTGYVYTGDWRLQTFRGGNRSGGRFTVYDWMQRPTIEYDLLNRWRNATLYDYRTLAGQPLSDEAVDANITVTFPGEGYYYDLSRGTDLKKHWDLQGSWSFADRQLSLAGSQAGTLIYKSETGNNFGLYVSSKIGKGSLSIHIGKTSIELSSASGTLYEDRITISHFSLLDAATDFFILHIGNRLAVYQSGMLIQQSFIAEDSCKCLSVNLLGSTTISALACSSDPVVILKYTDSDGTLLQNQTITEDGIITAATLHNPLCQVTAQTRPLETKGIFWGYREGFASQDLSTGTLSGEIAAAYPEDEGYPFHGTSFEKSPNPALVEMGQPGRSFAIQGALKDRTTIKLGSYYLSGTLPNGTRADGCTLKRVVEPDGKENLTVTDSFDNEIYTIIRTRDGECIISGYDRDYWGRITTRHAPNEFSGLAGDDTHAGTIEYDRFGNLKQTDNSDTGVTSLVHDHLGRLHYFRTSRGEAEGFFVYRIYDHAGRVIEDGLSHDRWDYEALARLALAGGGQPPNSQWTQRKTYSGDSEDIRQWGNLVSAMQKSAQNVVHDIFSYDDDGQITIHCQKVDGLELVCRTVYDQTGNKKSISLTTGSDCHETTYLYDLTGRMIEVRQDGTRVCLYNYGKSGQLVQETLAPDSPKPLHRKYTYNSADWVLSLEDELFSQQLSYDQKSGRIVTINTHVSGTQEGFPANLQTSCTYSPQGRLLSAVLREAPSYSLGREKPCSYDKNGNLTTADSRSFSYEGTTNRLEAEGHKFYRYSRSGETESIESPEGTLTISSDPASGRVIRVSDSSSVCEYQYGQNGLAAEKSDMRAVYMINDQEGRPLCSHSTGGETCLVVYGLHGAVAQTKGNLLFFLVRDYQSSVRMIYDGETVRSAFHYSPLGEIMDCSYDTCHGLIPVRFTGQILTPFGLYRSATRWYDPGTGRFLSIDPESQFSSPYLYGNCDWINYIDEDGACSWGVFWRSALTIIGGTVAVVAGIALSVASGGLSGALVAVGVAVIGGTVAGAGFGVAIYGLNAMIKDDFNTRELGVYAAMGAAMGAASTIAGGVVGAMVPAGGLAIFSDTVVGVVIGGLDGYITNGWLNTVHNTSWSYDATSSILWGAFLGGIFAGASGVGRSINNASLAQNCRAGSNNMFEIGYAPSRRSMNPGHSYIGNKRQYYDLSIEQSMTSEGKVKLDELGGGKYRAKLPVRANARVVTNTQTRHYRYGFNDCVTFVRRQVIPSGYTPPLWAKTPALLWQWTRLMQLR